MNPASAGPDPADHIPVLLPAVIFWLQPAPGKRILDGTVGGGGHAEGLLARGAVVLGLDRDADAVENAGRRLAGFGQRVILRQESYRRAGEAMRGIGWATVDGILLDLGLSTRQLNDPQRGMGFRADGPLDMRFDRAAGETAADLLNTLPAEEIAQILFRYGEEREARRIASAVVRSRPLSTTRELADLVVAATKSGGRSARSVHPATRTFQALRIAVNHELDELEAALPMLLDHLGAGGRLAVISFHSLEDRIVKHAIREASGRAWRRGTRKPPYADRPAPAFRDLTPRPILPDAAEIAANPRSRSAKLRVAERMPETETAAGAPGVMPSP
jgi:16S rRNA (cytosine1402-N4)-methyltransferase